MFVLDGYVGYVTDYNYEYIPGDVAKSEKVSVNFMYPMPSHEEIVKSFAYNIWESRGCPQGQDKEIWFEAENNIKTIKEFYEFCKQECDYYNNR
jgi:hypothetical protein